MNLTFPPLTRDHLDSIQLRPEDASEVSEGWKEAALEGTYSRAAVDSHGRVVAVYGWATSEQEVGPWLLCSDLVRQHRRFLARHARRMVQAFRQDGRLVFNYIPKDSPGNRRFVERLGFRILPSPGEGPDFFYLP